MGHAIQDRTGYGPLHERTKLIRLAQGAEKAGSFVMLGIPIVAGLTRSPAGGLLVLLAGLAVMSMGALVHLVTLPVEWDASFAGPFRSSSKALYSAEGHGRRANHPDRRSPDLRGRVTGRIAEHLAVDHAHATVSGRLGPFVSAKGPKTISALA